MKRSLPLCLALASACGGAHPEPAAPVVQATVVGPVPARGPEATSSGPTFHAFMPRPVTSFGAVVLEGRLYVLGGYDGTPHSYRPEGQSGALWSVDLASGRDWRHHSDIDGLQGLALVGVGQKVCRVGGMRADADGGVHSTAEFSCFDLQTSLWTVGPALPEARSSHDAITIGSTAYVVGGWTVDGSTREGRFVDSIAVLDIAHPEAGWRSVPAPFRRRGLGVAALGTKVYAVGGIDEGGDVSSRIDTFDTRDGSFANDVPNYPSDAFGIAVEGIGDELLGSGRDGRVMSFTPGESEWRQVGTLAFPRFFHHLVARNEHELLAVGGIRGMSDAPRTAHIESVSLRASNEPRVVAITLPYSGAAKNRQGTFLKDDALHLFGGNNSLEQHDFAPENFVAEHWVLDLAALRWRRAADYPYARQTIQTLSAEENGIAIGGFGHQSSEGAGEGQARTQSESFNYAFENDAWTPRTALPVARSQFGATLWGERIWIFGGLDYDASRGENDAFRHLTEIVSAPLASDGAFEQPRVALPATRARRAPTETRAEMSSPRRAFGGAVMGDRYYVVGGMRGEFELVEDCQAFDFTTLSWSPIACPAHTRLNPQLIAIADKLYLVGGTARIDGELTPDRSIEVYDPSANTWSVLLEDAGINPQHLRAYSFRDRLMLVSTHNTTGQANLVFVQP